jgi:hypothetical protein
MNKKNKKKIKEVLPPPLSSEEKIRREHLLKLVEDFLSSGEDAQGFVMNCRDNTNSKVFQTNTLRLGISWKGVITRVFIHVISAVSQETKTEFQKHEILDWFDYMNFQVRQALSEYYKIK